MSRDTTQSDSRLTRRQRTALATIAVVCLVLVPVGLTAAQNSTDGQELFSDGFEDGNLDKWTETETDGTQSATTDQSYSGDYSLYQIASATRTGVEVESDTFFMERDGSIQFSGQFMRAHDSPSGSLAQHELQIGLTDGNETIYLNDNWEPNDDFGNTTVNGSLVSSSGIAANAEMMEWNEFSLETDPDAGTGTFSFGGDTAQFTLSGETWGNPGQVRMFIGTETDAGPEGGGTAETWVDDVSVTGLPAGDLRIGVNSYMRPNQTEHFTVEYQERGTNNYVDVTDNATVNSSNSTILDIDPANNTATSTNDTSLLPATVTVNASYQNVTATKDVTIAKPSVENLDILPTWWKVNATVGDGMMLWLIVATLAAVVATRAATSFAGVGAYVMFMTAGWMTGSVSDGVMVATILTGLFLGMNLAANVDTTIRGSG